MKINRLILLSAALILAVSVTGQNVKVEIYPESVDGFLRLRDKIATTPEGGATMFLLALKTYVENPELGKQFLVIATDKKSLQEGTTYMGFSLRDRDIQLIKNQMKKNNKIPKSYIQGSSPENGYSVKLPYEYKYKSNTYSGNAEKGPYKLFVFCSGADSPRPITLKKNKKGIWKASSWSSVLVGVKKSL